MTNFSDYHSVKVEKALAAIVVNNDAEGTGLTIDTADCEAVLFAIDIGVSLDTLSGSVLLTPRLESAPDDGTGSPGTWAPILLAKNIVGATPNATTGAIATIDDPAEDDVTVKAAYVGNDRFVRCYVDTTGTHTNGTPISAVAIKTHLKRSLES